MNRQITLASRPKGFPVPDDFELIETPIPQPGEGEVLSRTLFMSVDPYMRGRMNDRASYAANVQLGEVMVGSTVGEVVASNDPNFEEGDRVHAQIGWQAYGVAKGANVRKVDPDLAPVSTALGVLGMPGLTAYCGLLLVGQPRDGETVLVTGAAGAVGSIVGQIAKIKGCRVVGVAGSAKKIAHVVDALGFDAAFNYKEVADYSAKLQRLCPDGIDVYFDNVGGAVSDAVFPLMNVHGRIAVCGQISQYNLTEVERGPRFMWHFIAKRLTMRGFLVSDFADQHAEGLKQLAVWVNEGRIEYREDIWEGLERAPEAFIDMLRGGNIGKRLVKVAD